MIFFDEDSLNNIKDLGDVNTTEVIPYFFRHNTPIMEALCCLNINFLKIYG